jgi:hypothetical protein
VADLKDVIDGMVTAILSGYSGTTSPVGGRVFGYGKDAVDPPCMIVLPSNEDFVNFDVTMDGADEFNLSIVVLAPSSTDRAGQRALMDYFSRSGTLSLRTVLYANRTLGGTVSDLLITSASGWGDQEWAGVIHLGGRTNVRVYT